MMNHINKLLSEASNLCDEGRWEDALILYRKGIQLRPHCMACRAGEQRVKNVIKNILKGNQNDNDVDNKANETSPIAHDSGQNTEKIPKTSPENNCDFKELTKDLKFMKKAQQNKHFPNSVAFDSTLNHLNSILRKNKPIKNTTSGVPLNDEIVEQTTEKGLKEAVEGLEAISDPTQLLTSAKNHIAFIEVLNLTEANRQVLAMLHYLIMKSHIDLGNYEEADASKVCVLRLAAEIGDEELATRALFLEGRSYALRENYIAAIKTWQDLLKKTVDSDRIAHILHEVGNCFLQLKRLDSARAYGILSCEAATEARNDVWLKKASVLVAQIETLRGNTSEALERYTIAEKAMRRLGDQKEISRITEEIKKLQSESRLRRPKLPLCSYLPHA